jgi:hypothetical protein
MCLLLDDDEWNALPGNLVTPAVVADPAANPPVLAAPAVHRARPTGTYPHRPALNANAATIKFWESDTALAEQVRIAQAAGKTAILASLGPALCNAIKDPTHGTTRMSIPQIMAAIKAYLGQYTPAEVEATTAALKAPISSEFAAHLTQQIEQHAILANAGQPLSEYAKITAYQTATGTSAGITKAVNDWLTIVPRLADRRFTDLAAYLRIQEANITSTSTLTHTGYAPGIASLAAVALAATTSPPPYGALTQAELGAIRAILQQQQHRGDRSGKQRGDKYCAIHGNSGHTGLECRTMATDKVKYAAARVITAADQITPAIAALRAAAPRRDPRPTA